MIYLRFDKKNNGYFGPDTGEALQSIEGRRNIRRGGRFTHQGYVYPQAAQGRRMRVEREGHIILELNIPQAAADAILNNNPGFNGRFLTPDEILALPEIGPP